MTSRQAEQIEEKVAEYLLGVLDSRCRYESMMDTDNRDIQACQMLCNLVGAHRALHELASRQDLAVKIG